MRLLLTGALVYYVRIREAGRRLDVRQVAVFLAIYLCALNSKEMAVTLPAILLAYEWFYHGRKLCWTGPAAAAILTLPVPGAWALRPGTRRRTRWRKRALPGAAWAQMLFLDPPAPLALIVCLRLALAVIALRGRRPVLRLCWVMIALAPLRIGARAGRKRISAAILSFFVLLWCAKNVAGGATRCRRVSREELASADRILDCRDGRLFIVR